MPTPQLSVGVLTAIAQNEVWALPSCDCTVFSGAILDFAMLPGGPWTAAPASWAQGMVPSGAYVRCSTGIAQVILKK
jgi:hypothetical protein